MQISKTAYIAMREYLKYVDREWYRYMLDHADENDCEIALRNLHSRAMLALQINDELNDPRVDA